MLCTMLLACNAHLCLYILRIKDRHELMIILDAVTYVYWGKILIKASLPISIE